ncbi:MAG: aldehyde dehydrogenase family protein, partial [Sporomusaceae bacterium]|nr:aldehyde dehydrogenase family protein [Sporomusaceae bacterium]
MNIDQTLITKITAEVLAQLQQPEAAKGHGGDYGVYETVDEGVAAAREAYLSLRALSIRERENLVKAMREAAYNNAELLAKMAVEESGMGRVADKIIKNQMGALNTPGTEDLRTEAKTGDHGLTLYEMGPYGVIGSITPTTNPSETIICNGIGMIAAGNAVFFSPHPTARNTSLTTIKILNKAIMAAGGPANLLTAVANPSLETTNAMMSHPGINMLVATGGPGVVKAVLSSGKKAIGAGAGNPPAVVDATADIPKA